MTTKTTKSERLFYHAYNEAKRAVEYWGAGKIDALSSLHDGTNEVIYQRTVNDIRRHAERMVKRIEWDARYCAKNGTTPIFNEVHREALAIVLKTCDNWESDDKAFKARLASL